MSSLKFCLWGGGNRNKKQEPCVQSPHKLDMAHVDRLNMDCRHRAGFTYRLSRLKLTVSEKMGGLIANNQDLFFVSPILSVENKTSENLKTFFALPISVIK